jgi:hypothetical protein
MALNSRPLNTVCLNGGRRSTWVMPKDTYCEAIHLYTRVYTIKITPRSYLITPQPRTYVVDAQ